MNTEDLYRLLRTSHVQAQGIVDTVPDPLLVLDSSLVVQAASRSFFETFQVDRYETIGQPIQSLGSGQWDIPELRYLLGQVIPKATAVIDYKVEHKFPDLGRRTMLVTARTLHHPDGGSHSMLVSFVDVTKRNRTDKARDMLIGELRHRMKNVLALAQSLARQTSTQGRSAEEYKEAFLGRFSALMEAQDIAVATAEENGLAALAERILAPYSSALEAILIEPGEEFELDQRTALPLSLVLHELATNAAKYGALSQPGGQVHLSWIVDAANKQLRISWVERGGPAVKQPSVTGYGTELITSATRYSLGGRVEQKYLPDGLVAEVFIPLEATSLPG